MAVMWRQCNAVSSAAMTEVTGYNDGFDFDILRGTHLVEDTHTPLVFCPKFSGN